MAKRDDITTSVYNMIKLGQKQLFMADSDVLETSKTKMIPGDVQTLTCIV